MRKQQRTAEAGGSSVVAQECEAFLNGTLAEYWEDKGIVVPVWAWINLLAHGSAAQIARQRVAAQPHPPSRPQLGHCPGLHGL